MGDFFCILKESANDCTNHLLDLHQFSITILRISRNFAHNNINQ